MATRSEVLVCRLSFAGITGSIPVGDMDVVSGDFCRVDVDHSSRWVLQNVVCLSVITGP